MTLIQGDAVNLIKTLEDNSVNLTVTSPPYDNLKEYNGNINQWNEQKWKDTIKELFRVTKQNGVVVWVVGDSTVRGSESGTSFKQALWAKECGFNLHDTMIYQKNSSTFPARKNSNRYTQIFEYMFVFSKGIPQPSLICDKPNKWAGYKDFSGKLKNPVPDFSPRNNIWNYVTSFGDSGNHPAPFPEKLAHDHILTWSKEGDVVLDPFMGSGTTGKMAKLLNRDFIGFELDSEYLKIAEQRINGLF